MKAVWLSHRLAPCLVILSACLYTFDVHADVSQRQTVTDLIRLTAYGQGPVNAMTAGAWATPGARGQVGISESGCDSRSMPYRVIVKPRTQVAFESVGAQRVDVIIRALNAVQELSIRIDGESHGSFMLSGGWQRITVRTPTLKPGRHLLEMVLTPTGQSLGTESGIDPAALALLHSIRPSRQVRPSQSPADKAFGGQPDALWLEPGEMYRIPISAVKGLALETAGLKTFGPSGNNTLRVEVETIDGAVQSVLSWPTALAIPWNLDLERPGLLGGAFLRLSLAGHPDSAVGLIRPRLTVPPSATHHHNTTRSVTTSVTLILVPGLTADDADAVVSASESPALPRARRVSNIWAVDLNAKSAVTSILTGLYPNSHGVMKRTDRLAESIETIGQLHAQTDKPSVLRVGQTSLAEDDAVWSGFTDRAFASRDSFRETAESVLDATSSAHREVTDAQLTLVVLGDLLPPLLPRQKDWMKFWLTESGDAGEDKTPRKPLWDPMNNRSKFAAIRSGKLKRTAEMNRFVDAMRRGKASEVMRALDQYLEDRGDSGNDGHVVVVVGLAGRTLPDTRAPEPHELLGPMWVIGDVRDLDRVAVDHTDIAPWVLKALNIAPQKMQGSASQSPLGQLHVDLAFASSFGAWAVVASPDLYVSASNGSEAPQILRRNEEGWGPLSSPTSRQAFDIDLMTRQLDAWRAAGGAWREGVGSPAHASARPAAAGILCE